MVLEVLVLASSDWDLEVDLGSDLDLEPSFDGYLRSLASS